MRGVRLKGSHKGEILVGAAILVGIAWHAGVFATSRDTSSFSSKIPAVWVQQSDGSQQCQPESGRSLDEGAQMLRDHQIQVLESSKGDDGKLRAQTCGASSGTENRYRIPVSELPQAIALGYRKL